MEMLNEMAIFAQVVESGSFSAAARQLGVNTSAVSRHVTRLEAHMGGRLLQRTTRSFALTELGQEVLNGSKRILQAARETHALAGSYSQHPSGVIRVTAPVVFGEVWLAPLLPCFLDTYPDVSVRLTLTDNTMDLIEEGVDLALRISRELAPGLAARPLGRMRYILVATPDFLQQSGTPGRPEELGKQSCIYLGYGAFGEYWAMQTANESCRIRIPARLTINNSAAILAAVLQNGGIGLVPFFTAREAILAGQVVQVLPEWEFCEPYAGKIFAVYTPGRHLAPKIRVFIDYLVSAGAINLH
ncbi:LysR family transcriptional regulator [Undibacterium sp. TS12]|uniref:LysR family transcriptional regulator n=1 Tax=Undibacterium sp. TS12 TaxID=2908202 RepID=UPI001F4CCF68|nr:LysR family transcriptional regulator [Undibacterium sp. TS12]MCH8622879.1 LysR family transcriptional regulator [Undibacterium sp. TS12]